MTSLVKYLLGLLTIFILSFESPIHDKNAPETFNKNVIIRLKDYSISMGKGVFHKDKDSFFEVTFNLEFLNTSDSVLLMPDRFIPGPYSTSACNLAYEVKICENDSTCEPILFGLDLSPRVHPRTSFKLEPGKSMNVEAQLWPEKLIRGKRYFYRFTLKKNSMFSRIKDIPEDIVSEWFSIGEIELR